MTLLKSRCSVICWRRVSSSYFSLDVKFVFCERGDKEEFLGKFLSVSPESSHHTPSEPWSSVSLLEDFCAFQVYAHRNCQIVMAVVLIYFLSRNSFHIP